MSELETRNIEVSKDDMNTEISKELEAAQALLEEYKRKKQEIKEYNKEIRNARKTILIAKTKSAIEGKLLAIKETYERQREKIESKIAEVQAKIEQKRVERQEKREQRKSEKEEKKAKTEELWNKVSEKSKKISEDIEKREEALYAKNDKFAVRQHKRNTLENVSINAKIKSSKDSIELKTLYGSVSARMAKMPYTLAARFEALKGNKEKTEELLKKAEKLSCDKMKELAKQNHKKQMQYQKKVTTKKNFAKKIENGRESVDKAFDRIEKSSQNWKEKYEGNEKSVEAVAKTVKQDKNTQKIGKFFLGLGQKPLTEVAKAFSMIGINQLAENTQKLAGKYSNFVLKTVSKTNTNRHTKMEKRFVGHNNVDKMKHILAKNIDKVTAKEDKNAEKWAAKKEDGKIFSKTTRNIGKVVTSIGKFISISKINRYERAAHRVAERGDKEKAEKLMDKAKTKSSKIMENAETVNAFLRKTTDRVVESRSFKGIKNFGKTMIDLPEKTVESTKEFFEDTKDKVELRYKQVKLNQLTRLRETREAALKKIEDKMISAKNETKELQSKISGKDSRTNESEEVEPAFG